MILSSSYSFFSGSSPDIIFALGDKNVTIQNLQVIDRDEEKGLIIVSGNVPGSKGKY